MPEPLNFAKSSLAYAKLVATPTDTAWSQVYNAGNLFACLELSLPKPDTAVSLHAIGKDLFNALEAEFFTLEEKNLASISQAIETALADIPENVVVHLSLAFFKDDILYLFIAGAGKIIMKRNDKMGILLQKEDDGDKTIATASGYLTNKDLVILQTNQFSTHISDQTLTSVMDLALPSDIAEALSPHMHESDDGGQAAIIIIYHGPTQKELETAPVPDEVPAAETEEAEPVSISETTHPEPTQEETMPDSEDQPTRPLPKLALSLPKLPHLPSLHIPSMQMTHRKKLFLSIFIVLIILLISSVFFTKTQEANKERQEQFLAVYTPAEKNYEEGKALRGLNDELSREDFIKAQQLITENLSQFPKGSKEEKQLSDLLAKIAAELGGTTSTPSNTAQATETNLGSSEFLSMVKANASHQAFGQNAESVFLLNNEAVITIAKSTGDKKTIIKNNSDWQNGKAVVPYQGNIYLLDTKNGVLKFTAGSDGFGKSAYFKADAPDLSRATSMAIDGSVWIVTADGKVLKYTRGVSDNLKISGLSKPLSGPTGIFTNIDTDSVYILDRGNSRVVKLSKEGAYQQEYAASVLSQAKAFDVSEKDKKIHVLSGDKFFEISMN